MDSYCVDLFDYIYSNYIIEQRHVSLQRHLGRPKRQLA